MDSNRFDVLYVDNIRENRIHDMRMLEHFRAGARLRPAEASDTASALDWLERREFDLLLIDMDLDNGEKGNDILSQAKRIQRDAYRVLFTAAPLAMYNPADDTVQEVWPKEQMRDRLEKWVKNELKKIPFCKLRNKQECLWATVPESVQLPNKDYCYVSMPYLDDKEQREDFYRWLFQERVPINARTQVEMTAYADAPGFY